MNVRQYFSEGDGKVRVASISGYPVEVPGIVLQHVVKSLGTFFMLFQCTCSFYLIHHFLSHRASGAI